MATRHPRIQIARDPDLAAAIERGRALVGPGAAASQVVKALALRGAAALDDDREAADRARSFLHDVAGAQVDLDAESLRSVRERAWG